jgi:hypothetical protein
MNVLIDQRLVDRVRAEYLEMPGMKLQPEQIQRLCGLDASLCRDVLDSLVRSGFLASGADGSYARTTDVSLRRAQPVVARLQRAALPAQRRRAS